MTGTDADPRLRDDVFVASYVFRPVMPESDDEWVHWAVTVAYRGHGRWAVQLGWGSTNAPVLTRGGRWEYEPQPSSRTDAWLKRCRYDLDDALRRAAKVLPTVTVNGMTAAEAVAWKASFP